MVNISLHFILLISILINISVGGETLQQAYPKCGKILPSPGTLISAPPYFVSKYCKVPNAFDKASTIKCLANRTVYSMGNSIGRQFLFNTLELLGGASVSREGQMKLCPKHQTGWDASCMEEYNGVKLKFLFFRYMDGFFYKDRGGFPYIKGHLHNESYPELPDDPDHVEPRSSHELLDNCVHSNTLECIQKFWRGATKDDILIIQLGFAYCEQRNPDNIDYMAWLRASATAFRSNVLRYFPGTIFRVNNADLLNGVLRRRYNGISECLKVVDQNLFELWHPSSFSDKDRWITIDQNSINKNHPNLYNDDVHFLGPLSMATTQFVLNSMCPSEGKPIRFINGTYAGLQD